jgi:hypothetical protein
MSKISFKKKHPILFETFRVTIALFSLTAVFTPIAMFAGNTEKTNIHSGKQIKTFEKVLGLKLEQPYIYKVIKTRYNVNFNQCIYTLEGLDLQNSEYYKCKKIANTIKKEFKNLSL